MQRRLQVVAAVGAALLALPGVASAGKGHGGHGGGGDAPKVVASGLDNPRGLAFGPDGALYVAEAGLGGPTCLPIPTGEGDQSCFGTTGAITRVAWGHQKRVVEGLPSLANATDGAAAIGPQDIAFDRRSGKASIVIGLGGDPNRRAEAPNGAAYATLAKLGWRGGARTIADVGALEAASNPAGGTVDSNPFSVVDGRHGTRYVSDAGGNSILEVQADGSISVLATFPDTPVDAPPELGLPAGTKIPMQAVPTGLVRGPDGALYVGQLTGFPFLPGAANVYRIVPGSAPEVYASGFTTITDLGFDERGKLYVLQASATGLAGPESPGSLVRVKRDGTRQTIVDGLVLPTGLAIRGDTAYISNKGPVPHGGEVLRVELGGGWHR